MGSYDIARNVLTEGNATDELCSLIRDAASKSKNDKIIIKNEDFDLGFDVWPDGPYHRLDWIHNKSGRFKGADILQCAIIVASDIGGEKPVTAFGMLGDFKGVKLNGAYTMLRWGFLPEDGVEMLNALLGEDYPDMETAFRDPNFWKNWKIYSSDYEGIFDTTPGSLSWDLLKRKI